MFPDKLKMLILQILWTWICIRRWSIWMWFIKQVIKLIKLLLPRDLKIQQTRRVQSTIQPNPGLPDYEVFPIEIKNKTWGNISPESFFQWCLRWYCLFQEKYFQCTIVKSRKRLYRRANFLDKAVSFEFGSKLRCFESFYGAPIPNPAKSVSMLLRRHSLFNESCPSFFQDEPMSSLISIKRPYKQDKGWIEGFETGMTQKAVNPALLISY